MGAFLKNEIANKDLFIHIYQGTDKRYVEDEVHKILVTSGYKKIEGDDRYSVFEKGSRTARLLLGAFSKYFKFKVIVEPQGQDEIKVSVLKETSGMSGGLIGVNQVKKEFKILADRMSQI